MGRRELLDLAGAVAGSFVSRNNDVDGYWSLGLLRSYADSERLKSLRFNILNGHAEPPDPLLLRVAEAYRQVLARQLTIRRIANDVVLKAEIVLTFDRDAPNAPSAATYSAPFFCTVQFTDRHDRELARTLVQHCVPHNPQTEVRSMRSQK
jgi:hypothetical protein